MVDDVDLLLIDDIDRSGLLELRLRLLFEFDKTLESSPGVSNSLQSKEEKKSNYIFVPSDYI